MKFRIAMSILVIVVLGVLYVAFSNGGSTPTAAPPSFEIK